MKKLIYSTLFILVALFAVDRLGGGMMWWINQHTDDVSGPKIKYLVHDVKEDLVMMGTSRCNLHYVPSILSDTLSMSVYNGGIDASNNVFAHYIMLNHILSHHHPSIVGLEVMISDYIIQAQPFSTVTFFAPYIGLNGESDAIFKEAGTYWYYKLSHLYRYNAKAVSNIAGLLYSRQKDADNGYIPNPQPARYPEQLEYDTFQYSCDTLKIKYLRKFISQCHDHGIVLFFAISPQYSIAAPEEYDVLKDIAAQYDVPVFDYHSSGLFHEHPEYFRDKAHLWDKGARLYSAIFAHDLKAYLDSIGK